MGCSFEILRFTQDDNVIVGSFDRVYFKLGEDMGRLPELILILAIFILLFGAQKLPEVGAALGKAIREFKKNMRETEEEIKKPIDVESSSK